MPKSLFDRLDDYIYYSVECVDKKNVFNSFFTFGV